MAQHVDNNEDIFLPRSDRLQIPSAEEYELLWGRPRFSQSDAEISNVSHQELTTTAGNFIRLETLHEANDRIANATASPPIFRHFDIGEAVHSSSFSKIFWS